MNAEALRDELRRQPFVPVRLYLTNGKTYDVKHPEMAVLTRTEAHIGVEAQQGSGLAERVDLVSLLHVVRLEKLGGQTAAAT